MNRPSIFKLGTFLVLAMGLVCASCGHAGESANMRKFRASARTHADVMKFMQNVSAGKITPHKDIRSFAASELGTDNLTYFLFNYAEQPEYELAFNHDIMLDYEMALKLKNDGAFVSEDEMLNLTFGDPKDGYVEGRFTVNNRILKGSFIIWCKGNKDGEVVKLVIPLVGKTAAADGLVVFDLTTKE